MLLNDHGPGAYEDPRARLVIGNGIEFITKKAEDNYFDVILMDTLDPIDGILSFGLFNIPFYKSMASKVCVLCVCVCVCVL